MCLHQKAQSCAGCHNHWLLALGSVNDLLLCSNLLPSTMAACQCPAQHVPAPESTFCAGCHNHWFLALGSVNDLLLCSDFCLQQWLHANAPHSMCLHQEVRICAGHTEKDALGSCRCPHARQAHSIFELQPYTLHAQHSY